MKTLVYGTGAIGSLLAHGLCRAGNDVTVVARSAFSDLQEHGLVVRHVLQHRTTVDRPRIVSEADGQRYDIVFSAMQSQQQDALAQTLSRLNAPLVVLVGNNTKANELKKIIEGNAEFPKSALFAFQNSAGHREGYAAVCGRLPVTGLVVGDAESGASDEQKNVLKEAFKKSGCKLSFVENMNAYYHYHIAEIMPYLFLAYKLDYDLKKARPSDIKLVMKATGEAFDYFKGIGFPVTPEGEDAFYGKGLKSGLMFGLYFLMSRTLLGKLMLTDHAKNGRAEVEELNRYLQHLRSEKPGTPMPTWDMMAQWIETEQV